MACGGARSWLFWLGFLLGRVNRNPGFAVPDSLSESPKGSERGGRALGIGDVGHELPRLSGTQ